MIVVLDLYEGKIKMINSNTTRRTLINVCAVDKEKSLVTVCIPGWNPHEFVDVSLSVFPQEIRESLNLGVWLFGYVNTGAEVAQDLIFERIEECLHTLSAEDEL